MNTNILYIILAEKAALNASIVSDEPHTPYKPLLVSTPTPRHEVAKLKDENSTLKAKV